MKKLAMLALLAVLSLGLLTACGGGGDVRKITVDMGINNEMDFAPDALEVKKGETVEVTIINRDTAQNHTFVVKDFNVKSKQVTPGQQEVLKFKATKSGSFEILCDVPGHKEGGMVGTLKVTE